MPLTLNTRLGPYEILAPLGAGGMGEVYRAKDSRLDREVAIKVLPDNMARDPLALARFEREAKAVAALSHPNILAVYDIGRHGATSFAVFQLLEGETLRAALQDLAMSWRRAVEIGICIAEGLAAAHAKGVVHRDLKPENIFLTTDGSVKILDFGLAHRDEEGPGGRDQRETVTHVTHPGAILGTPAYMSPEQARGGPTDIRTDIFALGCIVHEIVAGRSIFGRSSVAETLAALLHDDPPSLLDVDPHLPLELDRVIRRCLEKSPLQRFQTAHDLAFSLRSILSGSETRHAGPGRTQPVAGETPSIAVLPFTNMSADPDNEFFSDGVSEEIINALARFPGLHVAARTSAFSFKGKNEDLHVIGEKLNVRAVLEGSVRKSGSRVRITAQLIGLPGGYHLWSERFDRDLNDVFEVQDEIARKIAERLQVTLAGGAKGTIVSRQTDKPEAYERYVKGRALLYRRGIITWRALESFRAAVELDPGYALAWAGVSDAYAVLGFLGLLPPGETLPPAEVAAAKALELAPDLAEAHNAAAMVNFIWKWDWGAAERGFKRSLELNPNYVQARCWYGLFYLQLLRGRHGESLAEIERALQVDPLSAYARSVHGLTLAIAGHHEKGIEEARRGFELDSGAFASGWLLLSSYLQGGRSDEAVRLGEQLVGRFGRHPWIVCSLANAYVDDGQPEKAVAVYDDLIRQAQRDYVQPSLLAVGASLVGRMDEAFPLLDRACDEHDCFLSFIMTEWHPARNLYADPRFAGIRKRMGLDPT